MKKIFTYFITIFFLALSLSSTAYALEENSESIDVNVYINDMRVPIIKCNNDHYIKIDTLKEFGFDAKKDEKQEIINIYQNPNIIIKSIEIDDYVTECPYITDTKYKVFINDCVVVDAKEINNDIVININSFISIKGYDFEKQDYNKDNSCNINITSSNDIKNLFTMADKTEVHITERENYLYSDNDKVGLIQDNMEWISLDYIKKLIDFDKVTEEKDEYGTWIYLEKGNYEVKIRIENGFAYAECGRSSFELTAIPFKLNDELYLSLIDSVQLFNLEVIKNDNFVENKKIGPDYGNIMNGINIIKNNDEFYYIDNINGDSLCRANQDMSDNNKIINGSVDEFYIENQTIYYIGYNNKDKNGGIFKSNLDGTDKQQIVSGAASFLNILDNKIYYCEGSDGGNLCTIDKDGHNKKTLIQGKIAYPNLVNGWIYYIDLLDNSSIYKAEIDGSYNVKINTKSAKCLNVDNNKVYFSDEYCSYSMNHDGSFENELYDRSADNILVSEDNIYWLRRYYDVYKQDKDSILGDLVYEGKDSSVGLQNDMLIILLQDEANSIQRYDIGTGKNDVIDIQDAFNIEEVRYPYVYYKPDGGGKLLRYNIDTKSSEIIVPERFCMVCNIIDDWIYYDEYGGLYRVKTDGTNNMKLLDKDIYYPHIDNSGIYYLAFKSDLTNEGNQIIDGYYKVNLDGTNRQILINDLVLESPFEFYKDYIYYYQEDDIYRVKKDGTDKKKIINQPVQEFKIIDDHIYYKSQGDLYSAVCDGKEQEKIIEDSGLSFTKYKDNIFNLKYDKEYTELFKYNLTSKQSEQVQSMNFPNTHTIFVKEKDNNLLLRCSADEKDTIYYLFNMDTDEAKVVHDNIKDGYISNVFIKDDYLYYVNEEVKSKFIIK